MSEYADEARVLGEIGTAFRAAELPPLRVTVPAALAARAVAAWERDDEGAVPPVEDAAERVRRHRAGTLALIGLTIKERGQLDAAGNTVVDLSPELIGVAMDAADKI
ncbi:hypothetical protein [Kribbella solani]|uniref:Uncharacterized protein n=1 Tax=Kribbella solani TaxID=236067 RepID=A0A841DUK7_9ACTN|nr:hypothetical protein [Kribbella solani]MBB5981631.1 hypothetical protein [Kribbella solani]